MMNCENCEYIQIANWPKGKKALRCFSKKLNGRVVGVYPQGIDTTTEPPMLCPLVINKSKKEK